MNLHSRTVVRQALDGYWNWCTIYPAHYCRRFEILVNQNLEDRKVLLNSSWNVMKVREWWKYKFSNKIRIERVTCLLKCQKCQIKNLCILATLAREHLHILANLQQKIMFWQLIEGAFGQAVFLFHQFHNLYEYQADLLG